MAVQKIVAVVSEDLDVGKAANVVGLLGISLGRHVPGIVGPDVHDAEGLVHAGMSTLGLPVLSADAATLGKIHAAAGADDLLRVYDVTDAATRSRDYAAYTARLQEPGERWQTLGVAIVGPRHEVDQLTGRLRLLR